MSEVCERHECTYKKLEGCFLCSQQMIANLTRALKGALAGKHCKFDWKQEARDILEETPPMIMIKPDPPPFCLYCGCVVCQCGG